MNAAVILELLDLDEPAFALPVGSLDEDEQARAARFLHPEDRRRFTHGRAWLRLRLSEVLGIEPQAVRFTTVGTRDKPALASRGHRDPGAFTAEAAMRERHRPEPLPAFNLSHSDRHGLLAISPSGLAVGIDIEVVRPFERATRIAARHFSERESAAIEAAPYGRERETRFFRTWTRKEAYLKLTGLGLPGGLASVETGTGSDARVVLTPPEHGLAVAWITSLSGPPPLSPRAAADAHAPALAALAAPEPVELRWR